MTSFKTKIFLCLLPYISVIVCLHLLSNALATIFVYHTGILSVLLITKKQSTLKSLFKGWNAKTGIPLLIFCSLSGGAIYFLWPIIILDNLNFANTLQGVGLDNTKWMFFIFYYIIINPIFEEVYWRGFLSVEEKKYIIVDILFAGYHIIVLVLFIKWYWAIFAFLMILIATYLWRKIRFKYNGLIIPYLSHLIADISVIYVAYLFSF